MDTKLPAAFKAKMTNLLGDDAEAFFSTYNKERTAGLRINNLKIEKNEWEKLSPFRLKPIPYAENGYYYSINRDEPGKHPYHFSGLYYIQEPSAMFVASLLEVKPGERVLDLCAAPGGKSTQLGAAMKNKGILVANEIHPKRAKALSENIERFGLKNAIVTNETPGKLANHFPAYFDKILVDAPCSGEGMFRKDPDAPNYWSEAHVIQCQVQQLNILDAAYKMLKENGMIVYSTCTFSPEENEQVIEHFLKKYPDMEIVPIEKFTGIEDGRPDWSLSSMKELEYTARLWPHKMKGEGHFAAKMRKRNHSAAGYFSVKPLTRKEKKTLFKEFYQFKDQFLKNAEFDHIVFFGSTLHQLPPDSPDLSGLKVLRAGLHIGSVKKNRFEPDHALAMAITKEGANKTYTFSLENNDWLRYLKGETILDKENSYNGWILMTINGFPLGWGKQVQNVIKNFYPKGLRIMM